MYFRFLFFVVLAVLFIQSADASGQEPRRNPLKEAERILKTAHLPSSLELSVKYLKEEKKNSLVGTKWTTGNTIERAGTTLEFISATSMKMTLHLRVFGDPDKTYEYEWKQEADGSFVIGDNAYWGKFEAGQKKLEV